MKERLRAEMDGLSVNTRTIRNFLRFLGERTADGWRHVFATTNWDYLLDREIDRMLPEQVPVPGWLRDSQVFHFNGTVEVRPDSSRRSCFLLEDDPAERRTQTIEGNLAFDQMVWASVIVIIGMSFECEADNFLLRSLRSVQDQLPIGEADWIIVNRDQTALDAVRHRIQRRLPHANLRPVCNTFTRWQEAQFPDLEKVFLTDLR